jgi:hypothetical protein
MSPQRGLWQELSGSADAVCVARRLPKAVAGPRAGASGRGPVKVGRGDCYPQLPGQFAGCLRRRYTPSLSDQEDQESDPGRSDLPDKPAPRPIADVLSLFCITRHDVAPSLIFAAPPPAHSLLRCVQPLPGGLYGSKVTQSGFTSFYSDTSTQLTFRWLGCLESGEKRLWMQRVQRTWPMCSGSRRL